MKFTFRMSGDHQHLQKRSDAQDLPYTLADQSEAVFRPPRSNPMSTVNAKDTSAAEVVVVTMRHQIGAKIEVLSGTVSLDRPEKYSRWMRHISAASFKQLDLLESYAGHCE